jgi:membrane protein CcdC involved in cytochrome C biogenesis
MMKLVLAGFGLGVVLLVDRSHGILNLLIYRVVFSVILILELKVDCGSGFFFLIAHHYLYLFGLLIF